MSLRLRLTLLYAIVTGGVLLVFGATAIFVFNAVLVDQIDNTLENAAGLIISGINVGELDELEGNLETVELRSDVYVQIWELGGAAQTGSRTLEGFTDQRPFDPVGLRLATPVFQDMQAGRVHLRVVSVPLEQNERRIGTLQIAVNLDVVDAARLGLTKTLAVIWIVAILFSANAAWLTLGQTLRPLKSISLAAEQINRADDLSRRIPYDGPADEIGSLVDSFNQTLERLEALFTSQQRLLADVSHELRTPLTVIKGNADLMRRMKSLDEESLTSIDQEAGRLSRLVGGLLLLAQAESGKLALVEKPVELDMLVTEVFQEMSVLAGNKVHLHLNEIDQVIVKGDRDRLKQVFINLVANAIQYTPHGGDVFLSLERIGEQGRVICRDTGPGIPAEDLPHIFERFYRAEKSRARGRAAGFGLGLSIANWIVERHGGRIEVNSKEGQGTAFAIWLPAI
ncbi:MAG TPA: HAMP domain-containing sensor histidine kinase [Anaerolineales bacterium]|jgi:two-component system OmpR family sensor kinase|nr:HAMP domain-containing sensor histidine kinase [Anaerolineales bacterium]HQX16245.1 HAMP domain-containing sensor histidine kinase [Anaerolineales bacterium]